MSSLEKALRHSPSSAAIVLPPSSTGREGIRTVTYSELGESVDVFRQTLAGLGILEYQDVISTSLINSLEFVVSFFAIASHRCIAAPLNPAYKQSEAEFYLSDTQSKLLLVHKGAMAEDLECVKAAKKLNIPIAEIWWDPTSKKLNLDKLKRQKKVGRVAGSGHPEEKDVALILHTSGTTGKPKKVPLTHRNLTTTMKNIKKTYNLTPEDRSFLVMPLFHVHGMLAGFLAPLWSGGSLALPPRFSASTFWDELILTHSNWYTAVPTMHTILLRSPKPSQIPKLRFIRSCSSALSPTAFKELEAAFGAPVLEAYAMTEAAHQMTSNPLPPAKRKPGTVGVGQGVDIKILNDDGREVEEGEVCIRGANVTPGYLNNPEANEKSFVNGFFRTGDRGRLDAEGYLTLTGRIKELINRGGEKISPIEVDSALLAIPGVGEAVSFGVPHQIYGEVVYAAVVLKQDANNLDEKRIQKLAAEKLSKFKIPEKIFIVQDIPKTATGKIQRLNIAKLFIEKAKPAAKL